MLSGLPGFQFRSGIKSPSSDLKLSTSATQRDTQCFCSKTAPTNLTWFTEQQERDLISYFVARVKTTERFVSVVHAIVGKGGERCRVSRHELVS